MCQPRASASVIRALRGLVDDAGMRAYLQDLGVDKSNLSRLLRASRDEEAYEPRVGLLEEVLHRARVAEEANGHRARIEELLSTLAGEPVRLGLDEAPPGPGRVAVPRVERRLRDVFCAAGELAGQVGSAIEDGQVDERERVAVLTAAAALQSRLTRLVRALGVHSEEVRL